MTHQLNQLASEKALEFGPRFMAGEPLEKLLQEYNLDLLRHPAMPSDIAAAAVYNWPSPGEGWGKINEDARAYWRGKLTAGLDALAREVEEG